MATVGCVYTVDPFVRTPEDILDALFQNPAAVKPETVKRSQPKNKRIFANLTHHDESGNETSATDFTMSEIAKQVRMRNPDSKKVHVFLQDGQPSLWEAISRHFPENHTHIEILDVIHAMGYLWQAAALFLCKQLNGHWLRNNSAEGRLRPIATYSHLVYCSRHYKNLFI